MARIDLFTADPDEAPDDASREPPRERCTPEKLLAFIRELRRMPTLKECKERFGGILGPMVDAWELRRRGKWPRLNEGTSDER
jgi:hypothetical protein